MSDDRDRIAIVGLSGRFPGARDISEFWNLLKAGAEGIRFFDPDVLAASGVPESMIQNAAYVPANGYLDDVELFDATFFGMSPREAEITDPQHRLFLQCAWHALEDAGHVAETFDGRIGVYAGCGLSTYLLFNLFRNPNVSHSVNHLQFLMGNSGDYLPTRTSYKLNLKGPSVSVNTACSSSLVAVHMACQSLLEFECDVALAGGAGIQLPQEQGYLYEENAITSPDGHCRAFDAKAGGTVSGNGLGIVVLRRLEEALADGDDIRAVILGSAINNDGADKVGYTAPSVEGQASVITEALSVADVEPDTIQYVEAHGTGTPVGDPIEIEALTRAFGQTPHKSCALGSVKTNVGHLDEAAGVTSLIKTVLALQHGQIPPSLHYQSPNPEIDFESGPFFVNDRLRSWPDSPTPRRAGVSSFGIGGTNAHVVLEQAPLRPSRTAHLPVHVVPVSAQSSQALDRARTRLADHLATNRDLSPAAVAQTQQIGRATFEHRTFAYGRTLGDLVQGLRSPDSYACRSRDDRSITFMFPGQGSQHLGMASELYRDEPFFREELDRCQGLFSQHGAIPSFQSSGLSDSTLSQTSVAQPAIFSANYAVARLWMHWGIEPDFLIGHSLGEYVAACLAGVFTLEDAVSIVSERTRLMQSMPEGAMLAVALPETEIASMEIDGIDLAAVNGPGLCVVSGSTSSIDDLETRLSDQGTPGRRLTTSHAFHSRAFDPILDEFEATVSNFSLSAPQIPVISNTTGKELTATQARDPHYWATHLRKPVLFAKGIDHLGAQGCDLFIETGPGDTLTKLTRRISRESTVTASLPHPNEDLTDLDALARATGRIWSAGVDIDWKRFSQTEEIQRIPLPGYPFEPERHWVDATDQPSPTESGETPTSKPELGNWFYEPIWNRDERACLADEPLPKRCLIFHCNDGVWEQLKETLEQNHVDVYGVCPGGTYEQPGARSFRIRPGVTEDYLTLADQFSDEPPECVVHLWSLSDPGSNDLIELGFHSLHALTQSLAAQYRTTQGRWLAFGRASLDVTGTEDLDPEGATLSGISAVIPLEYPSLTCRHIDIEPGHPGVVSQILSEIRTDNATNLSVWRDGERWLRSWKPLDLAEPADGKSIPPGGTYLITGGTGSMGMAIAEYMAEHGACHLVLTGRSNFPETQDWKRVLAGTHPCSDRVRKVLRRIEAIERTGSTVDYVNADVSEPDATKRLRSHLRASGGALDGIVHTAGELHPGLLARKTRQSAEAVLGPKVGARLQLESLLQEFQPSFLILCSSLSSISPIVGQGDYAAANAFLDAYAHLANRSYSTRTLSITWGFWQELGIIEKVRGDEPHKKAIELEIDRKGLQDAGIQAFARILSNSTPPQVVVSPDGLDCRSDYPWFDRVVSPTNDLIYFEGSVSASETWVLAEHRILGQHILPGTAYLEIARAAFAETTGSRSIEFRRVGFLQPLAAEPEQTIDIRTVLQKQETGWSFTVLSRDGNPEDDLWIEHARGEVEQLNRTKDDRLDLERTSAECGRTRSETKSSSGTVRFEASLSEFGPHWHNQESLRFGSDQAIGEFRLDSQFTSELDHLFLHPALVDNATGYLSIAEGQSALPFSYESVRIYDAIPDHIYSHVRSRQSDSHSASYDITITDSSGRVLVDIENYVLRRVPSESTAPQVYKPDQANAALALGDPGSLSTFYLAPTRRIAPDKQEVEIEVKAVGLNFLEVLYSLGMLPHDGHDRFPYGLECSGIVHRVGSEVTSYQPGDEVVAYANGCYQAYTTVHVGSVVKKPGSLSMDQAGTLPAAYLTAWFALTHAGRLVQGERVLVHSAAGGVGLAAVQVARLLGAEIFATAGTDEKREYLENLGIECVTDSRSPGYGEAILAATDGKGVDAVLNSLGEAFTEESLSVLARYGRFVELGKRAILANGSLDLHHFARQLTFTAVDVGPDMPGFTEHLHEVMSHINSGALPPLPLRAFEASQPADGFEYMAQGKHIGKIVFTVDSPSELLEQTTGLPPRGRPFDALVGGAPSMSPSVREGHLERDLQSDVVTETEHGIAQIWHDLLGVDAIKRQDNFFELNGDSLLAAQVISLIHRDMGIKLPFSAVFDAPTIETLAQEIDKASGRDKSSSLSEEIEEGVI